ncbi:hypothetical protein GGI13_003390 [Coemansia sp. RSA 455]|nr:hypothetical protein GGI13_003390 [Coemansia sp. RSA 455]
MDSTYCVLDLNTETSGTRLRVKDNDPSNDLNNKDVKKGLTSIFSCPFASFPEADVKVLHNFMRIHYFEQLYHRLFLALYVALNYLHFPANTSMLTSMMVDVDFPTERMSWGITVIQNTMFFTTMLAAHAVFLFVKGRLSEFKRNWVWLAFFSQVWLEHRSLTGAGELAAVKCVVLLVAIPFMLLLLTMQSRYPATGAHAISLCGCVSVALVFVLHAFMPYASMQNVFTAVAYMAVYFLYSVCRTFKQIAVKSKTL